MEFKIEAYSLQELGQRTNQEDSLFPALGKSTPRDRLFILCDGMGGHEKGEVASATVCEVVSSAILSVWHPGDAFSDELLQQALTAAYDTLDAKDDGAARKMGTTLTLLCLNANGATVAHIGDSRVYQLRPATKASPAKIVFRTQDHSLVSDLVKIGEITEEEAKHHPQKNVITRAMQPCQEHRAKSDIAHLTDICPGDYFYMCSDGMLEQSTDQNILNVITKPKTSDKDKLEMLRKMTEENKDNHTAHLIHIVKVKGHTSCSYGKEVKGIWVKPTFVSANKKFNLLVKICAAVVIAIAIALIAVAIKRNFADDDHCSPVTEKAYVPQSHPQAPKPDSAAKDHSTDNPKPDSAAKAQPVDRPKPHVAEDNHPKDRHNMSKQVIDKLKKEAQDKQK